MNDYPKIYSISTVGVRQHDNADYLLHKVRTDFTGNNGLGKSIIADLLQLIFIPLRDEWKPGTEGLDKFRKIEGIPLSKDWIQHAYSFLNIETSKGKFITIGVFIPRSSRVPVRPFIIQQGEDFENRNKQLIPFEIILKSHDFLNEDLSIFGLVELKRHLYNRYKIHLKDFYQRDQVNEYFNLLFKNQLLPFNLSKENSLKSFAKVLQSFSRAKSLDISKSRSLQDFLFDDNEEIKASFNAQKEILSQHIRNYHKSDIEIKILQRKQEKLKSLEHNYELYEVSKKEYLEKNTHFYYNQFQEALKVYDENNKIQINSWEEYGVTKRDYENLCIDWYLLLVQQKEVCNNIRLLLEDKRAEIKSGSEHRLKQQLQQLNNKIEKLKTLENIVSKHSTVESLKKQFKLQEDFISKKKKLEELKSIGSFKQFENSKWSINCNEARVFYNERLKTLNQEIDGLSETLSLYNDKNPNSLFSWAIESNQELTIEQESILVAYKTIFTKRVSASTGMRYTLNPDSLITSYERDSEGIWVDLGNVIEYVPLISKQIFNDKNKLKTAIESDKESLIKQIYALEAEVNEILQLNEDLNRIGYNQSCCEIYLDRLNVENWEINRLLTEDNINFAVDNFELFNEIENLSEEANVLDNKINYIIVASSNIEAELKQNNTMLGSALTDINTIKGELDTINISQAKHEHLEDLEKLFSLRSILKEKCDNLKNGRTSLKSKRDSLLNNYNSAKKLATPLKQFKDKSEKLFKEAKSLLEESYDVKFEYLLPQYNITEDEVQLTKQKYDDFQRAYESEYFLVASQFEESNAEKPNPELYGPNKIPYFSFKSLVNVLCGKVGLEGLTNELSTLNENLKTLGELQLKILTEVFSLVERQYNEYEKTVKRLNFFFEKNKVSDVYQFKIDFDPRKDINIDWIQKMKEKTRVYKHGIDLFTNLNDLSSAESAPDSLIQNIAKQFYSSVETTPSNLLDPKFYFTIKVKMEDEHGKSNSGSGGQAYTALALLCIGRLSIVQKGFENQKGVKFIIIEELSNIDDTNFNIFPEIARQFGYQLMTMTPKPFGSYTNEEWYLHMLVKGKQDKERNYTPMSFFKTKSKSIELPKYLIGENELETA